MEKDLTEGVFALIRQEFAIEKKDIRRYSPLSLAYIGDAVYEVIIRSMLVAKSMASPNALHHAASGYVKASTQARMMDVIEPLLDEEEAEVFTRGRNAKSPTTAKNQSVADYRRATGFEALVGYLYLLDRTERLFEIVECGIRDYHAHAERY